MSDYDSWDTPELILQLTYWRQRHRTDGPLTWIVERCEQIFAELRRRDSGFERPPQEKR